MRLIDGDQMAVDETEAYMAAQEQIEDLGLLRANLLAHAKMQKLIADTPTVDAVPVVRCRECKYYRRYMSGNIYCIHSEGLSSQKPDAFCSYGERRKTQ